MATFDPPTTPPSATDRMLTAAVVDAGAPAHPNQINFGWLLRLRWSMIAAQLATILGVPALLGL
ncbi:MAG: hypothetical protein ABIS92_17165, partial [Polyangia bacterium]